MKTMNLPFACLLWLRLTACIGFAAATETAFDAANRLYEQGNFIEAASAYEQIIQSGSVSAALYFNLGNALFKAGQSGRALAAYQKAELISPRDPDLRASQQFVRSQLQGTSSPPDRWERWLRRLTINEWTALAVVPFWMLLLLLTATQFNSKLKRTFRGYAWLSGTATIVAAVFLVLAMRERSTIRAIVTAEEAVVRHGPLEESQNAFTLHDGAELRVLDHKNGWIQVSMGNRSGWLKREQVVLMTDRL
jgi:tetratricopeptide (TPR) repeat protein